MSRAKRSATGPLPMDRLWEMPEAMRFFGAAESWVRQHVPAVELPGKGGRPMLRYRPSTCHEIARRFERGAAELHLERAS
ncbi:MAG TPA: hypothetical protein VFQ22_07690 [Longimicrobiales bacterium]|nr:hypothetical protein [Longimicrobiales bacterium]